MRASKRECWELLGSLPIPTLNADRAFNKTTAQSLALYIAVHIKADMTVKRKRIAGKVILPDENTPVKTPVLLDENIRRCIEIKLGEGEPVIIINHDDPEDELRAAKLILGNLQPNSETVTSPMSAPTPISNSITLSELVEKYTEEQIAADNWSEKTAQENGAMYRLLIAITGDIPVDSLKHPQARDFKSALLKWLYPGFATGNITFVLG